MALDRMTGLSGIKPMQPTESLNRGPQGAGAAGSGLEFKRALEQISQTGVPPQGVGGAQAPIGLPGSGAPEALKFSNHAVERMRSRGISFSPSEMQGIQSAVTKAAAKGAKDTLVLSGDNALIVSVKNKTVVTVMDRAAMKENVFTNIDSTVVI